MNFENNNLSDFLENDLERDRYMKAFDALSLEKPVENMASADEISNNVIQIDVQKEIFEDSERTEKYVDDMVMKQFTIWGIQYPSGSMKRRLKRDFLKRVQAGKRIRLEKHPSHKF